jgi:hypothetical protein
MGSRRYPQTADEEPQIPQIPQMADEEPQMPQMPQIPQMAVEEPMQQMPRMVRWEPQMGKGSGRRCRDLSRLRHQSR